MSLSINGYGFTSYQHPLVGRFFFFNDTATTEIYTLSLHDALPILNGMVEVTGNGYGPRRRPARAHERVEKRSEEHTSELQSPCNLVCRLLLEKKKNSSE